MCCNSENTETIANISSDLECDALVVFSHLFVRKNIIEYPITLNSQLCNISEQGVSHCLKTL